MIILIISILLFIVGAIVLTHDEDSLLGIILSATGLLVILFLSIGLCCREAGVNKYIARYNQFKSTIEVARKDPNAIYERAALTKEIIEWNNNLTNEKYDNKYWYWWDYWTSDKIAALPYIK